ncbi:MAG: MafI family immunity protein [Chlamydiales bacterium]|nr:MafI family immunity protein [Chlamydiales bacterium]
MNKEHNELDNTLSDREKLLMTLVQILNNYITSRDREYLEELITHNEGGIAFEEIVATIVYQKIKITAQDYEKFMIAGKSMNRQSSEWEKLKDLVA